MCREINYSLCDQLSSPNSGYIWTAVGDTDPCMFPAMVLFQLFLCFFFSFCVPSSLDFSFPLFSILNVGSLELELVKMV